MAPRKPAWVAEARALIEAGKVKTQKEVAEIFGKSPSTVRHHFPDFGRTADAFKWVPEAKRLLEGGASYREVSRTIGVDHSHISKHLPGYGWTKGEGMAFRRWLTDAEGITRSIWRDG